MGYNWLQEKHSISFNVCWLRTSRWKRREKEKCKTSEKYLYVRVFLIIDNILHRVGKTCRREFLLLCKEGCSAHLLSSPAVSCKFKPSFIKTARSEFVFRAVSLLLHLFARFSLLSWGDRALLFRM